MPHIDAWYFGFHELVDRAEGGAALTLVEMALEPRVNPRTVQFHLTRKT